MKTLIYSTRILLVALLLMCGIFSCKKKEDDIVRIQKIVPQEIIDALRAKGMVINEGIKPPTLDDAYEVSPYELESPYGDNDVWREGKIIDDYRFKFYGQTDKNEIKYDYYNVNGNDEGEGTGAFIAGDGRKFTIFTEEKGTYKNTDYTNVAILSGELGSNGIKNFQYAFVIKEKSGPEENELIAVNLGRLWKDGDGLSENISNFRLFAPQHSKKAGTPQSALSVR